ncbi:MAG: plasmid pRiA4b ORF-3 family protein, partial [Eubacteriales bacterium]|nr:plasmid pRiA4b ORF-3 family protein [Eubacteriales bacterium]
MKAYQLKIQIKNSHPPIWRRLIVPAGLSFSQLAVILNEAMGWCGYHLFCFELYQVASATASLKYVFSL